MNFAVIKKLPLSDEIIKAFPLSDSGIEKVARDQQEVKDILAGRDNRLLVIVGP